MYKVKINSVRLNGIYFLNLKYAEGIPYLFTFHYYLLLYFVRIWIAVHFSTCIRRDLASIMSAASAIR